MQKKYFLVVNFIFLSKKGDFFCRFSAFYGQRSVTAAWATRSPWSIHTTEQHFALDKTLHCTVVQFFLLNRK